MKLQEMGSHLYSVDVSLPCCVLLHVPRPLTLRTSDGWVRSGHPEVVFRLPVHAELPNLQRHAAIDDLTQSFILDLITTGPIISTHICKAILKNITLQPHLRVR